MKIRLWLVGLLMGSALPLASPVSFAQTPAVATAKMPFLHPLFSDNAVLQRDRSIAVWGWSSPGQGVSVGVDGKKFSKTKAGADGKWITHIGPYPAGGPHTLMVDGGPGEMVTRSNILFGDVWLCSGQSNMEMGMTMVKNGAQEIADGAFPNIRLFTVPKTVATSPLKAFDSQWLPCTPTNLAANGWGGFSATAFFFGRKLNQELGVPIGLLHSSWGGTIAEAWVDDANLSSLKDFDAQRAVVKKAAESDKTFVQQQDEWFDASDPGTKAGWENPAFEDADWKTVATPGDWDASPEPSFKNFDGIAWYRHEIQVPAGWAGKDLTIHLGAIDDDDTTFWNGVEIGRTQGVGAMRNYKIPAAYVKAGRNVLSIRVYDMVGRGGLYSDASAINLELDANHQLPLAGDWKFKTSAPLAGLTGMVHKIDNPNTVTVLNNGMIAPLVPYGLKGAIWYQGESNADRYDRAIQYNVLLPTLIKGWRQQFGNDFPFYIVQLAGYMAPDDNPKDDAWPRLREAQMHTAQTVPKTGIASAIDIGDSGDIHPKDKQDVGLRLALNALAKDYGKKVEYLGPTLVSAKRDGDKLVLKFDHTGGALTLDGDANRVFAVAGADKNYVWADAQVVGDTVVLSSPAVTEPITVRYAWSNYPRASLHNSAGLPATPFRTDK